MNFASVLRRVAPVEARGWAACASIQGLLLGVAACVSGSASAQSAPFTRTYANPGAAISVPASALRIDLNGTGPLEFFRVYGVFPNRDGSFVVVNGSTNEFRYFDARGAFVSQSGRKGDGPGEYQSLTATSVAAIRGDSLAVLDGRARRVSILSPTGAFVRSVSIARSPEGMGSTTRLATTPDGTVLVAFSEVTRMAPQPQAVSFFERYFRVPDADGPLPPTPLRAFHSEHFVQEVPRDMGGVAYWELAFGRRGSVATTRSGMLLGDAHDWSIQEMSPAGVLLGTHRVARPVAPLTKTLREEFSAAQVRGKDSVVAALMVRGMPFPTQLPAYSQVTADRDGVRFWVQAYPTANDAPNEWLRLDPRTSRAQAIRFPMGFRALAFTSTRVFGVWRDSDDVEHVQVYELPANAR